MRNNLIVGASKNLVLSSGDNLTLDPFAIAVDHTVVRLDKNYVKISWEYNPQGDTYWVYMDGTKVSNTPALSGTTMSVSARLGSSRTGDVEVFSSIEETGPDCPQPNYLPVVNWKSSVSAYRYLIYIDNALVRILVADSTKYTNKWQTTQYLSDGWHYLKVVARDRAGNTETSKTKWFRVWTPGTPVSRIALSEGSGAGLYDLTLQGV